MADQPWLDFKPSNSAPAAASAGPWLDFAAPHTQQSPGYLETLGKDLSSIPGALMHPYDTVKNALGDSGAQARKAFDLMKAGKWADAGDALPRAIPFLGPMAGSIKDDIDAGRFAPALARMTEMLSGKIGKGAAALVPDVASDAVKAAAQAGGKDLALGATKAATGAGGILVGHSLGGETGAVMGTMLGKDLMNAGRKQIATGAKAAYAAGKDKVFPPIPAPLSENPLAAGVANASTYDPAAPVAASPAALAQTTPPPVAPTAAGMQNPYYSAPSSTVPLPARAAPPPVNPIAGTNAPGALVSPPVAPPNASQYATGTLPVPPQPVAPAAPIAQAPAPVAAPPVVETPAPNASYAQEVADQIKASADAKDAKFADYLEHPDRAFTPDQVRDMSIDDYKALHSQVPTGKVNAKTGKPTKFTLSGDDTKMAARKDALESLMRKRASDAASSQLATDLKAKGITSSTLKLTDMPGANADTASQVRFQLQKLEAAGASAKP